MENKLTTSSKIGRALMWISSPLLMLGYTAPVQKALKEERERKEQTERELMRHFKLEIETGGFWGTKKRYIQRDVPLTDDQLNFIYNK